MYGRKLSVPEDSAFLFGPRGTGKSTWLADVLPDAVTYDLLDSSLALRLAREPSLLARELNKGVRRIESELDSVRCIGVYTGSRKLAHDRVVVYPYGQFLEAMWEEKLFV